MSESRVKNSVRNSAYALTTQGIDTVLGFVVRTVFINQLSNAYLGLNGLFSDILTILSLAELGVGTAIIYSMFKPVAEHDHRKTAALLNLYKNIYVWVGIFVAIFGMCLTPFLDFFISDLPQIHELNIIYWLYLFNTSFSYFFIHKKSILIATQNMHIASVIQLIIRVVQSFGQIIVLVIFSNFLLYLCIQILGTFLSNFIISVYVDRKYPDLKQYRKEKLDPGTKREISKNVLAMLMSKLSSAAVTSTDNILISKFVSTITLGLYSNYIIFTTIIRTIVTKIFESITGSVGNLLALDTKEKSYDIYRKLFFINFWMIGFCTAALFVLVNPFIELWIGGDYLLSKVVVFWICINSYMRFIRNVSLTYVDTYGLFWNFRWKSVVEALINFVFSLMFLIYFDMGISGVLLGTFTSNILTNFWYEPYVIYKEKFKRSVCEYFKQFAFYFIITLIAATSATYICNLIQLDNLYLSFIAKLISTSVWINVIFLATTFRTPEFQYMFNILKKMIIKR